MYLHTRRPPFWDKSHTGLWDQEVIKWHVERKEKASVKNDNQFHCHIMRCISPLRNTKYYNYTHPSSIHCSVSSAPVGVQCPLISSLYEFAGYWDWLWYSGVRVRSRSPRWFKAGDSSCSSTSRAMMQSRTTQDLWRLWSVPREIGRGPWEVPVRPGWERSCQTCSPWTLVRTRPG